MPPQVFMNYIHPSSMLKQLASLWNQGQLCDAVITVDKRIVAKAHRLVLFAASPKLKVQAESSSDGITSAIFQVDLPSMLSQKSIDLFLHYLYEGYLMLTETVVHDMLKIADHLDLKCLYKCCLEYCQQNQLDIPSTSSSKSQVEDYGHVRLLNVDLKAEDLEPKNSRLVSSAVTSKDDSNIKNSSTNVSRVSHSESVEKTYDDSSCQDFTKLKPGPQTSQTEQSDIINLDSDDDLEESDAGGSAQPNVSCSTMNSNLTSSQFTQSMDSIRHNSASLHKSSSEKRIAPKSERGLPSCSKEHFSNFSSTPSQDTSGVYIKTEPNMSPSCSLNPSASHSSVNTDYTVTLNTSNYPVDTDVDIKPILDDLVQYEEKIGMSNEQMMSNQMSSQFYSETSSHSMTSADQQQVYMDQDSDFSAMQGYDNQSAVGTDGTTHFSITSPDLTSDDISEVENNRVSEKDCAICNKTFCDKSTLRRHMMIHTSLKPHKCPICEKCFSRKDVLLQHVDSHSSTRSHVCNICGSRFKQKCVLARHRRNRHQKPIDCYGQFLQ